MFQKSTFNQPNSTFGSSFQTQQNTSTFGSSTFGNPNPQTSFPQSTGAFGVATQSNNIFGNSTTTAPAFGAFQQQAQPTASVFGQQPTQGFGSTQPFKSSFNFSASSQPQQTATQQNLFSSNAGNANRGFGTFGQTSTNTFGSTGFTAGNDQNPGSSIAKYQPTNSTDTLVKNGQQNNISTRQHCITAMKEYENKSLEEIRFEDYSANRKGTVMGGTTSIFSSPQQQQQPNTQMNLFGSTQPQQTTNIFGTAQQENKNPFGQSTFGQTSTFGLNTSTADFGAKPFGAATNTFSMPSTDNNNSIFGAKPAFGSIPTSNSSVFGAQTSTAPTLFGNTTNAFAAPTQPLSAAPTSSFGTITNSSGFGSFASNINTNQTTNLFGAKPNAATLTNFNTTPSFGVSTQSTFPTFNANTTTSTSLFNTQTTKANTTFSGFGGLNTTLTQPAANNSFFSANTAKPAMGLGTTLGKPANSLFSNLSQPSLTTVKPNLAPQVLAPQSSSSKTLIHQQLLSKVSSPFGENPLFKNIKLDQIEDKNSQKLLPSKNPTDSLFKVNTKSESKQTFIRNVLSKKSLFEGLEEYDNTLDQCFTINKNNNRRLLLTPKAPVTPNIDDSVNKSSKSIVVVEDQENESININKRTPIESKQDSWLCPDKFKKTENFKEVSFENTMNELVPNKESEKEIPEADVMEKPINESGIILTRPGYFTIPSIDELNSYVKNDKCIVPNFTIGRTGYGNVYFNEEMDVFGLNLDVLVHFRHKEVTVYPDEDNKPPIGQGLNREAQITLDQVWPNDKTTQNYIKDIEQLNFLNFEGKLRRICEKKGVRFIEYRPETGSWVFKVKHFSKYGYNDSDDEDEIVQKEVVPNRQPPIPKESKLFEPNLRDVTANEKPSKVSDENENSVFFESVTSTIGKINKTNAKKLQLMKATYFIDENISDNEEMMDVSSKPSGFLDVKTTHVKQSEISVVADRPGNFIPEVICNIRFDYTLSALFNKCCLSDIALLNRNRFKSSFGRNNILLVKFPGNRASHNTSNLRNSLDSSLKIVSIKNECEIPQQLFLDLLKINFRYSERFEQDFSDCPVYKKKSNEYIVQDYKKAISINNNSKFEIHSFLKSLWNLCSVLWSDVQNEKQWCNNEQMARRNLFSKWLEDNCEDDSAVSYTNELLNLVLKHKVSEACDLAMANSDLAMALLLSQASNRKNFRDIVEDQLSSWNSSGVYKYINENRLKLIMVISGVPIMETENYGTISLFENKNWLRILSIQHWYVNIPTCSIEHSVHTFDNLVKNNAIPKKCLRPTFYKSNNLCEKVNDVRYHILNLYSNPSYSLEKVINNVCNTSHVMDYVTSWMLLDFFKLLGYKHCSSVSERKVLENVALQLETFGLWEWAIYILLHIESKFERETSIQNVLIRNIELHDKESLDKQRFVIDDLGIPRYWIDVAKYYKSRRIHNSWFEFKFLLRANKNVLALQTFYSHMAPHAIINGNFLKISVLLEYLDKLFSNKSEGFSYWEITGQALYNFVNLLQTSKKLILEDRRELVSSIPNIKRDFEIIISKIKRMPTNSIYDVLCQTEICQNLHLLLNNLYSGSSQKNKIYYEMLIILEGLIPYDLLKI